MQFIMWFSGMCAIRYTCHLNDKNDKRKVYLFYDVVAKLINQNNNCLCYSALET